MNMKLIAAGIAAVFFSTGLFAQTTFKNTREAVTYYENLVGELARQVRSLQDDNAKLSSEVYACRQQMQQMSSEIQGLKETQNELRSMISQESEARNKQLGGIADKIQAGMNSSSKAAAADTEEYDYYEVQPGATLSAVSRACGVSIEELKRANNMKNDVLRVGQKLKIPRK